MDKRGPFKVGADPIKVRQRIMGQGMRILNALVEAYNDGILDDQNKQHNFVPCLPWLQKARLRAHSTKKPD